MTGRSCRCCGTFKSWDCFYPNSTSKSGFRSECKDCTKLKAKQAYPTQGKFAYIERAYGLNQEAYMKLYDSQKGLCAICNTQMTCGDLKPTSAVVDHCHTTGKIRGLLCHICNSGLGMFKDNESSIFKALTYLQRNKQ